MKNCLITFRSVTPAQRGEQLLQRSGYSCALQRTPRWMESRGCGYCLKVRHADVAQCVQLLQSNQIAFQKVYLQLNAKTIEELEL